MTVLPDVDKYRRPFIEPLGYLTLFAAQSENLLIGIIALLDAQPDRLDSDLASELAAASELVWPWKSADTVNNKIESRVVEPVLASQLTTVVADFSSLRERRHRAIHDAVEVGFSDVDGAITLSVGYPRTNRQAKRTIKAVSPEDISKLAREFNELRADLSSLEWRLREYLSGHESTG